MEGPPEATAVSKLPFFRRDSDEFELIDREEANLGPGDLAALQKWLQPTSYLAESSEFSRHLSSQAPETGLWICNTSQFQHWHGSGTHSSLWIKGAPGAGKSVTAASIIERLKNENVPVLFFFFRYILEANRRPRSLVLDWLAQLLPHSLRLQAILQQKSKGKIDALSDDELWEHLLASLLYVDRAYCVVDALDEMEQVPNDGFLSKLNAMATFRPGAIKLMMTSRPKQYLQSALRAASIVHINLENELIGKDIAAFVSYRLANVLPGTEQQQFRQSLQARICTRSQGLFLYARLLLDQITPILASKFSGKHVVVEDLVSNLPVGLEDMYNSMLHQRSQTLQIGFPVQVFLLECATHSPRPLRLNELANFMASVFKSVKIPGTPKEIARSACSPLLEIAEDETVQVIHHSFTEFLLDCDRDLKSDNGLYPQFPVLSPEKVHKKLAIYCLNYLQSGVLEANNLHKKEADTQVKSCDCDEASNCCCPETTNESFDYQKARLQHPFLEYAVTKWAYHASCYDVEDAEFFEILDNFVNSENAAFKSWVPLAWTIRQGERKLPSALHIAAFSGLTHYAKKVLHAGINVDFLDAMERTPLALACRRGHIGVVSLLIQNDAKLDHDDYQGTKPIHEAARRDYAEIVKILLDAGVNPLTPKTRHSHRGHLCGGEKDTKGETAIEYVSERGHPETILAMLPHLKQATVEELLCDCLSLGKSEAVQAILEFSSMSVNFESEGGTPLFIACYARNLKGVQLLLERGARVNVMCNWVPKCPMGARYRQKRSPAKHCSPLHQLVAGWIDENHTACSQILRLLIKYGANLEAKNDQGSTALFTQLGNDNSSRRVPCQKAIKSLLEAGADISASSDGDSPLHQFISKNRDIYFVKFLIQNGCSLSETGRGGRTVFHSALSSVYSHDTRGPNSLDEVIDFLLDNGARIDGKDDSGWTVLELAIRNHSCSFESFKKLLKACPEMDATRCIWSIERGTNEEIVKFIRELMSAGVSLEARDRYGRTPLLAHVRNARVFDALLACGAQPDSVGSSSGRGALHEYVSTPGSYNSVEGLRALVRKGLNPHLLDGEGNTLLHIAVPPYRGANQDVEFIQQLLAFGISINAQNKLGQTALMVHIEDGRIGSSDNSNAWRPLLELFQAQEEILELDIQDEEGRTSLHYAVMHSEVHTFRLIKSGADLTINTQKKQNILHLACSAHQSNVLGFLLSLSAGQDLLEEADAVGKTALHEACASGRPESVFYLLQHGANVNVKDFYGCTPLHSCAEFSVEPRLWSRVRTEAEEAARTTKNDNDRPSPRRGGFATFTDSDTNNVSGIIHKLITQGADVDVKDIDGVTPLGLALSKGRYEMIESLLSILEKADKTKNTSKDNPLSYTMAPHSGPADTLMSLPEDLKQKVLEDPARYIQFIRPEDAKWIAENDGNVTGERNDFSKESVLHASAHLGLTEIVACFGKYVKLFDETDSVINTLRSSKKRISIYNFRTVLEAACGRQLPNLEMLELLLELGVDINAKSAVEGPATYRRHEGGRTVLHQLASAQYWWQLDAIKFLVRKGAFIDALDEKGQTPLHIASVGNTQTNMGQNLGFWKPTCVEVLLDLGADPAILDNDGRSCIDKASDSPEILRTLLRRHGKLSNSALFSAIQAKNCQVAGVILDEGVSVNAVDTTDSCAVHYNIKDQARSALFCASFPYPFNHDIKDSVPLVKLLIDRGANLYAPLNNHQTLIHYVFEHTEYEVACAFLEFHESIEWNRKDQLGRTVFLAACNFSDALPGFRHKHWVEKVTSPALTIIDFNVDLEAVDNEGRNALHHLLDNANAEDEHILMFLQHPVSRKLLKTKDREGFTPLHCALRLFRPVLCEALMALGSDLLQPDPSGTTALHHIASQYLQHYAPSRGSGLRKEHKSDYYEGCERLWKRFQDLGGDINTRNSDGSPPLFSYLASPLRGGYSIAEAPPCHLDSFDKFFAEADLYARNTAGETALHFVAKRESGNTKDTHDSKLFEFLVGKGLDPLVEDNSGRSSLDVAAACDHQAVLKLFQYSS